MDAFHENLFARAATIDELLSDDYAPLAGQKRDADLAARRLAAWCISCASGDWGLFSQRLDRDGLSFRYVLERFATVRRQATAPLAPWMRDAIWIEAALQSPLVASQPLTAQTCAFQDLFIALVSQAESKMRASLAGQALDILTDAARSSLRYLLLKRLTDLSAQSLYQRFALMGGKYTTSCDNSGMQPSSLPNYSQFVDEMRAGGFRDLFDASPVLLRLIAVITRQWIDTSYELIRRIADDIDTIRRELLESKVYSKVNRIDGDMSDPHNGGRTVAIIYFEDGLRLVYKPKDLRADAGWYALVGRLNQANSPVKLAAARVVPRSDYGWAEFIEHSGCADQSECGLFFRRAGAWLALFHCFTAADMHQENIIADRDQPVPIDLEMLLQATSIDLKEPTSEGQAFKAALEIISNSVMMVGLLPAFGRTAENGLIAIGGMASAGIARTAVEWRDVNTDRMRPGGFSELERSNPNLPHVDGVYSKFSCHIGDFIDGFEDYSKFMREYFRSEQGSNLFDDFAGLAVRRIIRPTRFYYMLMQRLRNAGSMTDGVIWSAQADFIARLADWQKELDQIWPLHFAERRALLNLNIPHFVSESDGNTTRDTSGVVVRMEVISGVARAQARLQDLDDQMVSWQTEVIRQNTSSMSAATKITNDNADLAPMRSIDLPSICFIEYFTYEAVNCVNELSKRAVRRGHEAAWISLDWLGDAQVYQLAPLGPDLYNGNLGITVFLAAYAKVMKCDTAKELALAGSFHIRRYLRNKNAPRLIRSLGIGGATGLGSVVYALAVMSSCLRDNELLADALHASDQFTDDVIAADRQLDVMGGSAGAILGLLRLHRDTQSTAALECATRCGEHLLGQARVGPKGRLSWIGTGLGHRGLTGMSHGAAGFAYSLASLSVASGREDFADAARECIAYETSTFDEERQNWPDFRGATELAWPCQWCHGAVGIGLARIGMLKQGNSNPRLVPDVRNAVNSVIGSWPTAFDTLCCGALGGIELLYEAANTLQLPEIGVISSQRLMSVVTESKRKGDYRWNAGSRRFNLGLFRGVSGLGYTLLRRIDHTLPNLLIWE